MPIHVPGVRKGRHAKPTKRKAVMVLQLTAMVDMFTVLTVFLLQNYLTTGEIIDIPENIVLPQATSVKDLKPANVVTVSSRNIIMNQDLVEDFRRVKEQKDWMITPLFKKVQEVIKTGESSAQNLRDRIQQTIQQQQAEQKGEPVVPPYRKITLQSDQDIDYLTLKKVMYTVTEAGIQEINFAVLKRPESDKQ
jgi:biopolymer transport protein ExbD